MATGVGLGDEVIATPFTFVATAEMIVLLGAVPVFVDIEPDTCNIDASKIEAAITRKLRPFFRSRFTASPRTWTRSTPSRRAAGSP